MADRFYPLGMQSEPDVWKTSYEAMNEMRTFERSAYPPGTSIHQPGARDHFGYSTPGPLAHRLAAPHLTLTQEVGLQNPREHLAIPRLQVPDDRDVFMQHDVPEMMRSLHSSPMGSTMFSPSKMNTAQSFNKSKSLPTLSRRPAPPRLSEPNPVLAKLEDPYFSYFVPKEMATESKEKLFSSTLSKLSKRNRISFPFSGEGTGFHSQSSKASWWPDGGYDHNMPTSYRTDYWRTKKNPYQAPAASYLN